MGVYRGSGNGRGGVTLEDLKREMQSLNMRQLLAMQVHDNDQQRQLEEEMKALRRQISDFSSGLGRPVGRNGG
jgi:hypothetical protein